MNERFNKIGCILTFIIVSITCLGHFIWNSNDRNKCKSLLTEGWWLDNEQWQPASCMMHTYNAPELSTCLSHVVYVGDSIARQQYFAAIKLIEPTHETPGRLHGNYKFFRDNLLLEFWWDPYLNETDLIHHPSLLIVSTGAWHMRYLGDDYFDTWKQTIDGIFDAVNDNANLADAIIFHPIEIPDYDKLDQNRTETMTRDKINRMNTYLHEKELSLNKMTQTPLAVAFVFNEIASHSHNATQDGLHYDPVVTTVQNQIAFNFRCNNQLSKHIPMNTTCCYDYPRPKWYQLVSLLYYLLYVPLGFLLDSNSRFFPDKRVLNASLLFGFGVLYMYYGDRTQVFGKIHRLFNPYLFTGMTIAVFMLGICGLETNDLGFMNRRQTEEWKGWMQLMILIYHYCGASSTSGIYNVVRVLVAAYLFQTGYGHFCYFYKKADFGIRRVVRVLIRLNFLTCVLVYLMDADYLHYYFTPLVSFWFMVVWVTMYIGHQFNDSTSFVVGKIILVCSFTTACIHVPGVLESVFKFLKYVFAADWDPNEWRFRLGLDAYIVYIGMLCSLTYMKSTENKWTEHRRWRLMKHFFILCSILALVWYVAYELTRENKYVYNKTHPYISWIPILAFVCIRNSTQYLRNTHAKWFAFIGKISLETFIGQFHMWLAADNKGILVVLPKSTWVAGFGWWLNLAISSCLFVFVCHYMAKATHEITTWVSQCLCQESAPSVYQEVPLLPTQKDQDQEEEEEELPTKWLEDTRVKLILIVIFIALFNHACQFY